MNFIVKKHFEAKSENYRKAFIFTWNAFALFIICIFFSYINQNSNVYAQVSFAPAALLCLSLLVILYFTGNLGLCVNIACLGILGVLIKPILITGGVSSHIFMWLILSPLCALTIGNPRKGMVFSIITVLIQIGIYLAVHQKFAPSIGAVDEFSILLNHICFLSIVLVLMLTYELMRIKQQKMINDHLEKLIEQRNHNLQMIQQLQTTEKALNLSNKELKLYAFAAAHDLKELTRMIGINIQFIQRKVNNQLDSMTQNHMAFVNTGVKRMEELLRSLIVYSEVGDNSATKTHINLNDICQYAVQRAISKQPNMDVKIHIDELPTVYYYQTDLGLLFQNLIDNALKFRKSDVIPEVIITYTESPHEYLFQVVDNGIGIEPAYHEKVFNLFSRLHNRNEYEGSGIGLATCKKIVTQFGGGIWLNSQNGHGTTVYFSIAKM